MNMKNRQDVVLSLQDAKINWKNNPTIQYNRAKVLALECVLATVQERENRENITMGSQDILKVIEKERSKFVEAIPHGPAIYEICAEYLSELLPKKMTETEMYAAVQEIIAKIQSPTSRDMGAVISEMKKRYGAAFDAKTGSAIIGSLLKLRQP
jgi:uncharacterized protein YqeY